MTPGSSHIATRWGQRTSECTSAPSTRASRIMLPALAVSLAAASGGLRMTMARPSHSRRWSTLATPTPTPMRSRIGSPPPPSVAASHAGSPLTSSSCAGPNAAAPMISPSLIGTTLDHALWRPLAHETEHVAGDAAHLNLLGPFRDPVAPMVAVDVLERLVAGVAEA